MRYCETRELNPYKTPEAPPPPEAYRSWIDDLLDKSLLTIPIGGVLGYVMTSIWKLLLWM